MDDDLPFASHVVRRGKVFQYVRRIPIDLEGVLPVARIQRSLRTTDKADAYAAAAAVHSEVEKQFATARRKAGTTLYVISVDDWLWADWQRLADWFKATLMENDWRIRLRELPGSVFEEGVDRKLFWRDDATVRVHLDLRNSLQAMSVKVYSEERRAFVQASIRSLTGC